MTGYAQDIIFKQDGNEIQSVIIEITKDSIRYNSIDQKEGTTKNISISEVFMIIYKDGTRELFREVGGKNPNQNKQGEPDLFKIELSNTSIKVVDKRDFPLIIGEIPGVIIGTRNKVKDKKNKVFPFVESIFKENLERKGFSTLNSMNQIYSLEIGVTQVYYKYIDKFTYMQVDQICSVEVRLIRTTDNNILYIKDIVGKYSCNASDLRSYIKAYGHKKTKNSGVNFLIVIDDIVKQMTSDKDFTILLE